LPQRDYPNGANRDKLILNPALTTEKHLLHFFALGLLIGCAVRSTCCLSLNLASSFFKALLYGEHALYTTSKQASDELRQFDELQWEMLQFRRTDTREPYSREEVESLDLTFTTTLSDGRSKVELFPGGHAVKVTFEDRDIYRAMVARTRVEESFPQMAAVRRGLRAVVPCTAFADRILSWQELDLLVCGSPEVDLSVLKAHTKYVDVEVTHPIVAQFWEILGELTQEQRAKFIHFGWARYRLPHDMRDTFMKLHFQDPKPYEANFPHAATCFFDITLFKYASKAGISFFL